VTRRCRLPFPLLLATLPLRSTALWRPSPLPFPSTRRPPFSTSGWI
jgi:hypothetical protein